MCLPKWRKIIQQKELSSQQNNNVHCIFLQNLLLPYKWKEASPWLILKPFATLSFLSYEIYPGIWSSFGKIIKVMAIFVSLSFKRNVHIGIVLISILKESEKPFQNIENVEWNEEQFLLLLSMYQFMINHMRVDPWLVTGPQSPEKIHTRMLRN